jgi:hypothetical protein
VETEARLAALVVDTSWKLLPMMYCTTSTGAAIRPYRSKQLHAWADYGIFVFLLRIMERVPYRQVFLMKLPRRKHTWKPSL